MYGNSDIAVDDFTITDGFCPKGVEGKKTSSSDVQIVRFYHVFYKDHEPQIWLKISSTTVFPVRRVIVEITGCFD